MSICQLVTLHVSVWVEIRSMGFWRGLYKSRSTWACELKFCQLFPCQLWHGHAPRERVSWNAPPPSLIDFLKRHAPRERVSWNSCPERQSGGQSSSRSTWACELKFDITQSEVARWCHAPRERVSWNLPCRWAVKRICSHAPRERVSWNQMISKKYGSGLCHAPRERVSWNIIYNTHKPLTTSHAPRERVSWNSDHLTPVTTTRPSRSTWACELKSHFLHFIFSPFRHAPRERVSWNVKCSHNVLSVKSHAPRERVSWN